MNYAKRRLFIGIPLSDALRKRLARGASAFEGEAFLPVRPENYHVTLLFLGFVSEEEMYTVSQKIETALEGISSFDLSFDRIQAVDDPADPKMIWLSGEPNDALRMLREALEKAFGTFVAEKKSFRPHVTLAKIKRSKWRAHPPTENLEQTVHFVEPVESVALFESTVIDDKRSYEIIDSFPLG
ncbi:MAG: RNA 2',3'-cyclic phosphodiesterase [Candidatus Moraniibacteriota bacterium]